MREFKNSILADEDLIGILDYTYDKWGIEQQAKYERQLEKGRDKIRISPSIGKKRFDLSQGCYSYKVEHHYFFYRVRNEVVEIARVLHESMNFPDHIREEYFPNG